MLCLNSATSSLFTIVQNALYLISPEITRSYLIKMTFKIHVLMFLAAPVDGQRESERAAVGRLHVRRAQGGDRRN